MKICEPYTYVFKFGICPICIGKDHIYIYYFPLLDQNRKYVQHTPMILLFNAVPKGWMLQPTPVILLIAGELYGLGAATHPRDSA